MRIEATGGGAVTVANERVRVTEAQADVRPAIEQHLRQLASREMPPQVQELAERHGIPVNRIAVRNQRSR